MKQILFALLIVTLSPFAQAEQTYQEICGEGEAAAPYKYCIVKVDGSKSQDVLYYFHGGGGSEEGFDTDHSLRDAWKNAGVDIPVIIKISFGPMWLLTKPSASPNSGLLDVFAKTIMPKMEKLALGKTAKRRLLMGHSMGGFNATAVALHLPPETFAKIAILCPALVNLEPYASPERILKTANRLGVQVEDIQHLMNIAQAFIPSNKAWFKSVSPFSLAAKKLNANSCEMLVASNLEDPLFFSGGQEFAKLAGQAGASVEWRELPGEHCDIPDDLAVQFFTSVR